MTQLRQRQVGFIHSRDFPPRTGVLGCSGCYFISVRWRVCIQFHRLTHRFQVISSRQIFSSNLALLVSWQKDSFILIKIKTIYRLYLVVEYKRIIHTLKEVKSFWIIICLCKKCPISLSDYSDLHISRRTQ